MRRLNASSFQAFPIAAVIVFLCAAFFLHPPHPIACGGRPVLLPVTPSPLPVEERPDDITVSIEADLNRFINTKWYPDREFNLTMPRLLAQNIRARVLVRADRRLPFGSVRSLIHDIAIAGGDPIILLTEQSRH